MSGDAWLRAILVLVCVAFALRAASAMCSDAARDWYKHRANMAPYNAAFEEAHGQRAAELPEKPWYVKLHEWGRW